MPHERGVTGLRRHHEALTGHLALRLAVHLDLGLGLRLHLPHVALLGSLGAHLGLEGVLRHVLALALLGEVLLLVLAQRTYNPRQTGDVLRHQAQLGGLLEGLAAVVAAVVGHSGGLHAELVGGLALHGPLLLAAVPLMLGRAEDVAEISESVFAVLIGVFVSAELGLLRHGKSFLIHRRVDHGVRHLSLNWVGLLPGSLLDRLVLDWLFKFASRLQSLIEGGNRVLCEPGRLGLLALVKG